MLITKTVEVTIGANQKHYLEKGYDAVYGKTITVSVNDLPKSSHIKVLAKCECGNETELSYDKYLQNVTRHGYYGCRTCSKNKRRLSCTEKFGVDSYSKTVEYKDFMKENTSLLNEVTKEKIKKTMVERYGVQYALQSDDIVKKSVKTLVERYGAEHYNKSQKSKIDLDSKWEVKIKEKMLKLCLDFVSINSKERTVTFLCPNCFKEYRISPKMLYQRTTLYKVDNCTNCNPIYTGVSGTEQKIAEYIKSKYSGDIILGDKKVLNKKELDIYLPNLNLAIEYNGLYWHSEAIKSKNYHLDKTNLAESKGIKLIHIYEDDWIHKQDIVKSRLDNLLGLSNLRIYARKTLVKGLSHSVYKQFLESNHLQGYVNAKNYYGLYYENELVSVMSFAKVRRALGKRSGEDAVELLRFCNKLNTSVVGAASKLLKHFIKEETPKKILTYADRSWSTGDLYEKLGFDFKGYTIPGYAYINRDIRENRWNYRKDVLVKQGFNSNLTEHEIMLSRKLFRIYDSGNCRYEKTCN